MKAYTSSNSSSAMSVAGVALGRSTTSPDPDGATDSPGRWGSTVMKLLREEVPAEEVGRVGAPQVRPRVHDDVPGPVGGRIHRARDHSGHVRVALGVGDGVGLGLATGDAEVEDDPVPPAEPHDAAIAATAAIANHLFKTAESPQVCPWRYRSRLLDGPRPLTRLDLLGPTPPRPAGAPPD